MRLLGLIFRRLLFFLFLGLLLLAGVHFTLKALRDIFRTAEISTPDYTGKSLTWILEHQPEGVELQIVEKKYSSEIPVNHVLDQKPRPGTLIKRGRSIYVTISLGSDLEPIPSVQGLNLRDAGSRLRNQGLAVGRVARIQAPAEFNGQVIAQEPPAGAGTHRGEAIDLLIGMENEPQRMMPAFTGLSLQEGMKRARSMGLEPRGVRYSWDPDYPENQITGQEPRAGLEISRAKGFSLVVNRSGQGLAASTGRMRARIRLNLPPGLESRRLRLELVDAQGGRVLSEETHAPGETFEREILFTGQGYLNVYLDGIFFQKVDLQGEPVLESMRGEAWR